MKRAVLLISLLVAGVGTLQAQVTRATVAGRVADPSGAVIPNASITITDTATGAKSNTKSGADGFFTLPYLEPGPYTLSVEASGFKKYALTGITLHAEQHATENVTLKVGSVTETVQVKANNTLLDTQTASAGQVLTTEEVEALPSNGRSPIGFARDEYGVVPKEKHLLTTVRPFDNAGGSDFAMGGGNSQSNEILLNGVPNMQDQTRVSAFSPELDAVSEIVADDFESSAVYGDTSNGIVNVTTKSGTNKFHGTLSEFNETNALAARQYFQPAGQSVPATRQNQYGLTIGGPIVLPRLFNGHDKLFFFYSYEGFTDSAPSATITTVPTAAERNGDFSALLPLGCPKSSFNPANPAVCSDGSANQYQLYNPYNATFANGKVVRQPYANNIITSPLDPVGQAVMKYYPMPNYPGEADGEGNYFSNFPNTDKYFSNMGRVDYNVNAQNKLFFEMHQSSVTSENSNYFNNLATGKISNTDFWGGTFDDVEAFSPTLSLDNRLGYTRSHILATVPGAGFDPTKLGFPSYISKASNAFVFPTFSVSGLPSLSYKAPSTNTFTAIQYFAELTKVWGRHTLEIGPDIRVSKKGGFSPDYSSGRYYFTSSWVNAGTGQPSPKFGAGPAELLLGLSDSPSNGGFDVNAPTITSNFYFAGYAQDYWHIRHNLTIDLGFRAEHETAPVESRNRINIGFDPTAVNAVTAPAEAAYAANPIPQLPAAQFQPTGGLTFASSSHRSPYSTEAVYWSPRVGFSWAPDNFHGATVFRAGFGIFYNPMGVSGCCNTAGYSETNLMVPTTDGYLTPAATLSDPYPASNPILQPTGSSLGVNTLLGQSIAFATPNVKTTRSYRWNFDVQQQLAKGMMFELGYTGSRQSDLSITNQLTSLPLQYLSHSPTRDATVTSELSKQVASPYKGLGSQYGSKISVAGLLTPYSEFSGVAQQYDPVGYSNYNALMARVTKHLSNGLQFNANFEWSRQLEASSQLNPGGPLWYGETASDFPIHFVLSGLYDLPFGRGQMFAGSVNHAVDALIGGWALSSIYTWNSGAELSWGNSVLDWSQSLNSQPRNLNQAFNTSAFDRSSNDQPNSYNYRTFPSLMMRSDATNDVDLSAFKTFHFGESRNLQYRLDTFNAFNRPQFAAPNTSPTSSKFGKITGQANTSRVIQMGLRFAF